ncbi:3-keto-disaccharide hydrolase [Planctomicrobium sp. SH664]|uniref:3-keto-disaccharide hydrolase n=1 Tax=Planctomicrobium sp. SH664 TaxID=3448125 RepID=UPI003F5C29BF
MIANCRFAIFVTALMLGSGFTGFQGLSHSLFAEDQIESLIFGLPVNRPIISLVGKELFEPWQFVSGKKDVPLEQTWRIEMDPEPVLICTGQPYGFLRTRNEYTNFEFGLEWKFPKDACGNSGVLLFTSAEERVWPTALQVQLLQSEAGAVFPIGGQKTNNEIRNVPPVARPVNQWNECRITCREGVVTVQVNGREIGEVSGCLPRTGGISLQSEGAEVHFRRIWIREIGDSQQAIVSPPAPPAAARIN